MSLIRKTTALLTASLLFPLSGCADTFFPAAEDIAHTEMMETLAVDAGEGGLFRVTASGGVRPGDDGGESQPPVILSAQGVTIANACLTIELAGDSDISYSHVLECVLGEDLARESVRPLVEYLERDYETRMSAKVFLASDRPAGELLTACGDAQTAVTDRLEAIARDVPLSAEDWPYTLNTLAQDLADNGAALIPTVYLDESGENPELCPGGLAWLRDGKLGGILSDRLSRAAWLLEGRPENSIFEVELSDGGTAALRLNRVEQTLTPVWSGDTLAGMQYQAKVGVALADYQSGDEDLHGEALLSALEGAVSRYLENSTEELLRLSQEEGADFLHLCREMALQSPAHKVALAEHWEDWFPALTLEAEVETEVERSYNSSLP